MPGRCAWSCGADAVFSRSLRVPTLAVVPRQTIERHGDRWLMARPLPVSGAYQLVSWRLNDKIRLRKNPYYWDSANTQSEVVDLLPASAQATS